MNNSQINKLRNAGFRVKVLHLRRCKVVMFRHDKIYQLEQLHSKYFARSLRNKSCFIEILPNGGETHITISDYGSKSDFIASTVCRNDEPFVRSVGIQNCLEQLEKIMYSVLPQMA